MHPEDHIFYKIDYTPTSTYNLLQKLVSLSSSVVINTDSEQLISEVETKLYNIQNAFMSAWKLGQWEVIDEIGEEAATIKFKLSASWLKRKPLSEIDTNSGVTKKQHESEKDLQQSTDDESTLEDNYSQDFIGTDEIQRVEEGIQFLTYQELNETYERFTQNQDIGDSILKPDYIMIDVRKRSILEWLQFLIEHQCVLPKEIQWIEISHLGDSWNIAKEFMTSWIQNSVKSVVINDYPLAKLKNRRLKINEYMKSLSILIPKITNSLYLEYFRLESKEFSYIIQKCSNLESLNFCNWVIDTESTVNFGTQPFDIINISFDNWKILNSEGNMVAFSKIAKAIAKSNLKHTLKSITNYGWNVNTETMNQKLKDYELFNIYAGVS